MNKSTVSKLESQKDRTLSAAAFDRLLRWLDQGTDSKGENYLVIRQRLVNYFDRKAVRLQMNSPMKL
jgi:hypothetical protein